MEKKKISVIVPVYKAESYLNECIESIVGQTYKNLEIILVNDGSPDGCPEMCDEWVKKDRRIKVIHKKNAGAAAARNAGLDIATGDYIGFVDSDDYVSAQMYETLLEGVKSSNCKIASCFFAKVCKEGIGKVEEWNAQRKYSVSEAITCFFCSNGFTGSVCDKLYARELFDDVRFPEGETNEDDVLFIPLAVRAGEIIHTGKQLYFYRSTEGSVTQSTWKTDASIILKHLYEIEEQLKKYDLQENMSAFRVFSARYAYGAVLHLDKNYERINRKAKENHKKYLEIVRKRFGQVICSSHFGLKDKILYIMVATRTLRPVYKMLGRL